MALRPPVSRGAIQMCPESRNRASAAAKLELPPLPELPQERVECRVLRDLPLVENKCSPTRERVGLVLGYPHDGVVGGDDDRHRHGELQQSLQ